MGTLDALMFGYRKIASAGTPLYITRDTLNIVGAVIQDNPITKQTDCIITGGGVGGWNLQTTYQDAIGTPLVVPDPGAGFTGVSQPFSNVRSNYTITMPTFARGVLVKLIHTSGDVVGSPMSIVDASGYKFQDPQNRDQPPSAGYSWNQVGASVIWEAVIGDPIYGAFWALAT